MRIVLLKFEHCTCSHMCIKIVYSGIAIESELMVDDQIICVNGTELIGVNHKDAVDALRAAPMTVELSVRRFSALSDSGYYDLPSSEYPPVSAEPGKPAKAIEPAVTPVWASFLKIAGLAVVSFTVYYVSRKRT